MKKWFVIILVGLYLITAVGITISVHFCGNELASVSSFSKEYKDHFCEKKDTSENCCLHQQFSFQLKDNQQQTELFSQTFLAPFLGKLISDYFFRSISLISRYDEVNHYFFHPPDLFKKPLYLIHQVFRI